jgi:hypothetical protein
MSRTHFAFFLARRPTKVGSPPLAEKLRWGSYFGESSAQKPPQAWAAKQQSNPQKRLRDGLLVTKAPHDFPSLGHFRDQGSGRDATGLIGRCCEVEGTSDTIPNARAVREKREPSRVPCA